MSTSSNSNSNANSRNHIYSIYGARAACAKLLELRRQDALAQEALLQEVHRQVEEDAHSAAENAVNAAAEDTSDSENEADEPGHSSSLVPINLPFEGLNPDLVIRFMKGLEPDKCPKGRALPACYKYWEKMNEGQRNKAAVFFDTLDNTTRQEILSLCRAAVHDEVEQEKERAALTNKNDKCRLLHLRADVRHAALWSMAFREMTRPELDAETPPNYYDQLAEAFNDYQANAYQNAVVLPNVLTAQGTYVARPGMELIARFTHDLNPCAYPRPMRDGAWVRCQLRALRAKLSVCWSNFKRSGQQDAENLCDEWCNFSTTFGEDVITYAYAVFTEDMLDHMGKRLTDTMQVDTGVLGETSPAVEHARKEKRKRDKDTAVQNGKVLERIGDAIAHGIEKNKELQELAQKRASKMKMIEMMLQYASDDRKERMLDKLSAMVRDTEDWDIDLAQLLGVNVL